MVYIPTPPAPGRMGYIGIVYIGALGTAYRAISSTLKAKQEIQHPDVVDNRIDRTLYQLGPITVDGDVVVPVVKDSAANTFMHNIWDMATKRDQNTGELILTGQIVLEYSYQQSRAFNECRVNSMDMKATQGDRIEATVNFMGTTATDNVTAPSTDSPFPLSPARVMTWDDVQITAAGNVNFESCIVRAFNFTINNNCSRNYTFCPASGLFASNISTGKRHINGSLEFQGFAATDVSGGEQNSIHYTSNDTLTYNFGGFSRQFNHIIYEFQSIDINVGLITSTVNWFAHGGTSKSSDWAYSPTN